MATDVSGLDPLTVSLRDYIDGLDEKRGEEHARQRELIEFLRATLERQQQDLETRLDERLRALEAHLDERADAQRIAMSAALASHDKAMGVALSASDKALEVSATGAQREFREHLEQVWRETTVAFEASDKAITKSELANEKRFESMNGFRRQLSDQAQTFMPREVADAQHTATQSQLADQKSLLDKMDGARRGTTATVGYLIAAATLVISLVVVFSNNVV